MKYKKKQRIYEVIEKRSTCRKYGTDRDVEVNSGTGMRSLHSAGHSDHHSCNKSEWKSHSSAAVEKEEVIAGQIKKSSSFHSGQPNEDVVPLEGTEEEKSEFYLKQLMRSNTLLGKLTCLVEEFGDQVMTLKEENSILQEKYNSAVSSVDLLAEEHFTSQLKLKEAEISLKEKEQNVARLQKLLDEKEAAPLLQVKRIQNIDINEVYGIRDNEISNCDGTTEKKGGKAVMKNNTECKKQQHYKNNFQWNIEESQANTHLRAGIENIVTYITDLRDKMDKLLNSKDAVRQSGKGVKFSSKDVFNSLINLKSMARQNTQKVESITELIKNQSRGGQIIMSIGN